MAVAAVPHEAGRPAINTLGLWLFFFSETFLFAALATGRFFIAGLDRPDELNQALGLGITIVLILSSLTAYQAETSIAHGDRAGFTRNLLATIVLGLVFVGGVGVEWSTAEFDVSEPYGTAFFSMTGLHASHVISGVVMLGLVYMLALRGHFSAERHWGVEATVKYWHFVDVVWVFFYPILYLVNF
jgi:cytochrome c oxidase subunit 3